MTPLIQKTCNWLLALALLLTACGPSSSPQGQEKATASPSALPTHHQTLALQPCQLGSTPSAVWHNETSQAVAEVERALALAESEGYLRTFLDEGEPMARLLTQVASTDASLYANYALRLLRTLPGEKRNASAWVKQGVERSESDLALSTVSLIEPLLQRELAILQLLAQGMTNREIARQLIIATGTVKAHAASIYRKLDVANRTEAVAHARQLDLLP